MPTITDEQVKALHVRSTLAEAPFTDRRAKGVRDAQEALEAILRLHGENPGALVKNLKSFLGEGPAWDSEDYHAGGDEVHRDVDAILTADRTVIAELLATLDETPTGTTTKDTAP